VGLREKRSVFCVWAAGFQSHKWLAFFRYARDAQEFRVISRSPRIRNKSIGVTLIESSLQEKLAEDVGETFNRVIQQVLAELVVDTEEVGATIWQESC
jgi:hypothetical protein